MVEEKKNSELPTPPFPAEHMPEYMKTRAKGESEEIPEPPRAKAPASKPAPAPAPIPTEAVEALPLPTSPPLFVKVDKYQNIVNNIQKLKSYSLGLRDALDALSDIEKELQNGVSVLNRALDNFNNIIALLDTKLLRVQGIEKTTVEIPREMDEYVKGVHEQVEKIRDELSSVS